jgi:hypothetical protein
MLSRTQDHSAAGKIRSIEKFSDLVGNRTNDLPACSIVTQLITLPRAPSPYETGYVLYHVGDLKEEKSYLSTVLARIQREGPHYLQALKNKHDEGDEEL